MRSGRWRAASCSCGGIRRSTRRLRRHTAAVLIVLALGAIIAVHRSAIASGEMDHAGRRLRRIARHIVRDQAKEIRTMNAWRQAWYGAPSPAGGVPKP
jgi:hypothetical protein